MNFFSFFDYLNREVFTQDASYLPDTKNISQYALIKDYGIDKAQLQRLRKNMVVKTVILNRLCSILDCKIEDIMEFVPDEDIK